MSRVHANDSNVRVVHTDIGEQRLSYRNATFHGYASFDIPSRWYANNERQRYLLVWL